MEKTFETSLAKINNTYAPMIAEQLHNNGIEMTEYQNQVVLSAISSINEVVANEGLTIGQVEQGNLTQILLTVAALQLNASADPREVYFIVRNKKDKNGSQHKIIEMNIEGDGNDALLDRFGRNIKNVYPYWVVRENDEFDYPKHKGLTVEPPAWSESGVGKVLHVVYPLEYQDGTIDYKIGEREDVKKNLLAHVSQNLMWDKSGAKQQFMEKTADMTLDEILDSKELVTLGKISGAWSSPQARESMIIRKIRNNIVKKIPKDFSTGFLALKYQEAERTDIEDMRKDVTDSANQEDFERAKLATANQSSLEDASEAVIERPEEVEEQSPTESGETQPDEAPESIETETKTVEVPF
ncbi:hypothetical protein ACFQ4L_10525 [Lapidilactobacillus mulanensis]|uniref:Recombinase RecT n=1 Tax=Lapidilactobacillus mulanensis TaxID=2485999 RepID=A0ABW4DTI0_9LACO|nr:hypothetical protein [Lapidilactobacillus mulanensis]